MKSTPANRQARTQSSAGSRFAARERRHATIRGILQASSISNQNELQKKLAARGFAVTQATLSRDVHDLNLSKGKTGYFVPAQVNSQEGEPDLRQLSRGFGLQVRQAMNLLVLVTMPGSAQTVAALLDRQRWAEIMGTIAGDDTVLVICSDESKAGTVRERIEAQLG